MRFSMSLVLAWCLVSQSAWAEGVGAGKAFNPDISVNLLGLYQHDIHGSNDRNVSYQYGYPGNYIQTSAFHNGLQFEEAETQFMADVDPYFRANALFSLTQKNGTTDYTLDPEEVYFESISLPVITLRAGKFKAAFGKHNQLHTHAYPFLDPPLINQDLLGGYEGLNEEGISAAALIPAPWYMELTAQLLSTDNPILLNSPNSGDFAGLANLRSLWDLSEDLTFDFALYGLQGANQWGSNSTAYGSDLIFKWRPVEGGKYKALIWQTEFMGGYIRGNPAGGSLNGLATWLQYQFAERWWVQGRYQEEGLPSYGTLPTKNMESVLLGFFPSEFSGFRGQFDRLLIGGQPTDYIASLQYNISIGAHPAHAY